MTKCTQGYSDCAIQAGLILMTEPASLFLNLTHQSEVKKPSKCPQDVFCQVAEPLKLSILILLLSAVYMVETPLDLP